MDYELLIMGYNVRIWKFDDKGEEMVRRSEINYGLWIIIYELVS